MPLSGLQGQALQGAWLQGYASGGFGTTSSTVGSAGLSITVVVVRPVTETAGGAVPAPSPIASGLQGQGLQGAAPQGNSPNYTPAVSSGSAGLSINITLIYEAIVSLGGTAGVLGPLPPTGTNATSGQRGRGVRGTMIRGGHGPILTSGLGPVPISVGSTLPLTASAGLSITVGVIPPVVITIGLGSVGSLGITSVIAYPASLTAAGLAGLSITTSVLLPATEVLSVSSGLTIAATILPPVSASITASSSAGISVVTSIIPPVSASVFLGASMTLTANQSTSANLGTSAGLSVFVTILPLPGTCSIADGLGFGSKIKHSSTYIAESLVTTTALFAFEDTPGDPLQVTLSATVNGVNTTYAITRESTGSYYAEMDTTSLPGTWLYEWEGSNGLTAIARSGFIVVESPV